MPTLSDFTLNRLDGTAQNLVDYADKVVLVVNVASKCGLTPQYAGLEQLYRDYGPDDFVILGFPCNQFAGQEPGSPEEIAEFCSLTYDVSFPMFAKLDVNGPDTAPLYAWLKAEIPGEAEDGAVEWNFAKFLIDRSGNVVARFSPQTEPSELAPDIEDLL